MDFSVPMSRRNNRRGPHDYLNIDSGSATDVWRGLRSRPPSEIAPNALGRLHQGKAPSQIIARSAVELGPLADLAPEGSSGAAASSESEWSRDGFFRTPGSGFCLSPSLASRHACA